MITKGEDPMLPGEPHHWQMTLDQMAKERAASLEIFFDPLLRREAEQELDKWYEARQAEIAGEDSADDGGK